MSLKYNHDASIALFKSVWIAVWNGNTIPKEGQPGQYNYMARSTSRLQLNNWTVPIVAFSSSEGSLNPIQCNKQSCIQWQPNLFIMESGNKLGCIWSGNDATNGGGTYLSTLDDPHHGKWTNKFITFGISHRRHPFLLGTNWTLFPSQNPATTRTGRIVAPVVMTETPARLAPDAPAGCHNRTFSLCTVRRSSIIYSDDAGKTWACSEGTIIPHQSWANWEPTVWEADGQPAATLLAPPPTPRPVPAAIPSSSSAAAAAAGAAAVAASETRLHMLSRYNDFRSPAEGGPPPDQRIQFADSTDGGVTWQLLRPLPVDTVVSRMQVAAQTAAAAPTANVVRWLMVMNVREKNLFLRNSRISCCWRSERIRPPSTVLSMDCILLFAAFR